MRGGQPLRITLGITALAILLLAGSASATEYIFEAEDYSSPQSAITLIQSSTDNLWALLDNPGNPLLSGGKILHDHIYENSPELTTTVPVPNGNYNLYVGGTRWDPSGTYDNWYCRSLLIKKQGESSYTSYGSPIDGSGLIDLGIVSVTGESYNLMVDDDPGSCDVGYYDYVKLVSADTTTIPEFPTIALPVIAVIGLLFIFRRKN